MPKLPMLSGGATSREMVDTFAGYNHNLKIRDGEFFFTKDLTNQFYPLLANRPRRGLISGVTGQGGTVTPFTRLQGIIAKDALCWVDNGTFYINGNATGLTGLQTEQETQLVSMGAYVCIFPDKKYINTADTSDDGSMGASWEYTGSVGYSMCQADGTVYTSVTKSSEEPSSPDNGDVWIDTIDGTVKEYSTYSESWMVLETVYTRLDFTTMGQISYTFKEYDGVEITGAHFDELNG